MAASSHYSKSCGRDKCRDKCCCKTKITCSKKLTPWLVNDYNELTGLKPGIDFTKKAFFYDSPLALQGKLYTIPSLSSAQFQS